MASIQALAIERSVAVTRRNAAIAALSERAGTEPPAQRGNGSPKAGTDEYFASEAVVSAWVLEQLARMQEEIDALKQGASTKGATKA